METVATRVFLETRDKIQREVRKHNRKAMRPVSSAEVVKEAVDDLTSK